MKIAVLISGGGTNLQAIIDSIKSEIIKNVEIKLVLSNRKQAYGLERAKNNNIDSIYLNPKEYNSREDYDKKVVEILKENKIDLVVLAGYLRWISKDFVEAFKNKIINIHPSLLPSFKGLHAIEQAYEYGVKVTGVTVHFVDETEDGGSIILQEELIINNNDTLEEIEKEIHKIEHKIYPKVIQLLAEGKVKLEGRKTNIL